MKGSKRRGEARTSFCYLRAGAHTHTHTPLPTYIHSTLLIQTHASFIVYLLHFSLHATPSPVNAHSVLLSLHRSPLHFPLLRIFNPNTTFIHPPFTSSSPYSTQFSLPAPLTDAQIIHFLLLSYFHFSPLHTDNPHRALPLPPQPPSFSPLAINFLPLPSFITLHFLQFRFVLV